MAERGGFEPPIRLPVYSLSRFRDIITSQRVKYELSHFTITNIPKPSSKQNNNGGSVYYPIVKNIIILRNVIATFMQRAYSP